MVTHFPIYWKDDSYPDMREKWASLFDRYGADRSFRGMYQYFRSYPVVGIYPGNRKKGTAHVALGSRRLTRSGALSENTTHCTSTLVHSPDG